MQKIIIATSNAGKVREFKEMFASLNISPTSLSDHFTPVPDIEETGSTFQDNAKIKADWVYEHIGGGVWTLADDSGLEVDALGGAPGVLSARYSGDGANALRNNEKLLRELSDVPEGKRTARFRCVLVLRMGEAIDGDDGDDGDDYLTAEGSCEGRIINASAGDKGFGYDPLFIPDGFDRTFAQLSAEEKNGISHRGRALRKLYDVFLTLMLPYRF